MANRLSSTPYGRIGYTDEQRDRRDRVAELLGPHVQPARPAQPSSAVALGKLGGRVFLVELHMEDGAWRERDSELDRKLVALERAVHEGTTRFGCTATLLTIAAFIAAVETGLLDDAAWGVSRWVLYGLFAVVLVGLWMTFDYLLQWKRYLRMRPQLKELMRDHELTPHELLARMYRPARLNAERSLMHFIAHDEEWRN